MICPNCAADITPEPVAAGLGICPQCLRSLVIAESRLATASDTVDLEDRDLAKLRKARAALRMAQ